MLNDNYTALCVNRDLLQCWRGRQIPSSLYQGIAQSVRRIFHRVTSPVPVPHVDVPACSWSPLAHMICTELLEGPSKTSPDSTVRMGPRATQN